MACSLLAQQPVVARPAAPQAQRPVVADDPLTAAPGLPAPARLPLEPLSDGKIDIEEIRHSVRDMLDSEDSPSRPMGTVFSAAPLPELQRFKNKFGDARRPWCLTAFQGAGVLALVAMPLAILLDKKDQGCKW